MQLVPHVPESILEMQRSPVEQLRQKWQSLTQQIIACTEEAENARLHDEAPEILRAAFADITCTVEAGEPVDGISVDPASLEPLVSACIQPGSLFVTSKRMIFAGPSGSPCLSLPHDDLILYAVPQGEERLRLMCHFDAARFCDAAGLGIPCLRDEEEGAPLDPASLDPDCTPYLTISFIPPQQPESEDETAGIQQASQAMLVMENLYTSLMDASMIASYGPALLRELLEEGAAMGGAGCCQEGCCSGRKDLAMADECCDEEQIRSGSCCNGRVCCEDEDEEAWQGSSCCRDADQGCCARERN